MLMADLKVCLYVEWARRTAAGPVRQHVQLTARRMTTPSCRARPRASRNVDVGTITDPRLTNTFAALTALRCGLRTPLVGPWIPVVTTERPALLGIGGATDTSRAARLCLVPMGRAVKKN